MYIVWGHVTHPLRQKKIASLPPPPPPKGASSQSGWGLMQGPGLGSGHRSLPGHEAEQPDCLIPRPCRLSTASRPERW